MSRPAQLEKQIERTKEIQAEMAKGAEAVEGTTPSTDGTPAVVTPEPGVTTVANESPATVSKEDYDKLEQRYRTLQGMHTADGQRFRTEMASMQGALNDLENRLVAAEEANKSQPVTPSRYVTAEDEEEYGDTLAMMRRAAKEEAEAVAFAREKANLERIANLERTLGYLQNNVVPAVEGITRSQGEQVKAQFWDAINVQVPDWRTVNDDPNFKAWLLAEDPVTGATRQQFLTQARNDYNAMRVIAFFKEWKRQAAGGQTPAPNQTQAELERLVAPGASKGGTTPVTPEKKTWTSADIAKFYADINRGVYANKLDERKKIEADLFAAQAEGRISR